MISTSLLWIKRSWDSQFSSHWHSWYSLSWLLWSRKCTQRGIKALLCHATTDSSSCASLPCRYSHCGIRAGLLVNVFPVIVFPLLSFGPSLYFWAFFFHIVGILEKDTHKQNHVRRGFCRRGADVSQHTTLLCSAAGHCVMELHGGNSGAVEGKDDWTGFC